MLLLLASYTDLKERIISNKLTYSGIVLGLLLHLVQSYLENDYSILLFTAVVTAVTFGASYGLWKMGVWAGGDVKLMTALAALNPINYGVLRDFIGLQSISFFGMVFDFSSIGIPVFPLTLFLFSIFAILPYGFFITLSAVAQDRELRAYTRGVLKNIIVKSVLVSAAVGGLVQIFIAWQLPVAAVIVPLVLIFLVRRYSHWLALLVFLGGGYLDFAGTFQHAIAVLGPLVLLYVIIQFYFISKDKVLKKEIPVNKLEEGMIPESSIYRDGDKVIIKPPMGMKKVIKYLGTNDLAALQAEMHPRGKEVVSARRAAGMEKEQVAELQQLAREGRIPDKIMVKSTAPFVPAILIAYVGTQLAGDLLWNWIM